MTTCSDNNSKSNSSTSPLQDCYYQQQLLEQKKQQQQKEHERLVMQVMGLVQQFINVLRSSFTIQPNAKARRAKQTLASSSSSLSSLLSSPEPLSLFTKLCQETNMVDQIQQLRRGEEDERACYNGTRTRLRELHNYDPQDERLCILYQIILPLLDLLHHYCKQLDENSDNEELEETKVKEAMISTSSTKNAARPPPPPSFLLSLQNYTDVAALIEIWVCYSVLVHVEPNILLSLSDRCRFALPKSLQGRLPRPCLVWAAEYDSSRHHSKKDRTHHQQPQQPQIKHERQLAKVSELRHGIVSVTRLLMLDRFRPMLLPRHLTDLYAAMAQADYECEIVTLRCGGFNATLPLLEEDDAYYKEACSQLGVGTNHLSTETAASSIMITPIMVNAVLQARTCQSLLRQGTKTPTWLRQRVTPVLTQLACQHMSALIQVFVVEATATTGAPTDSEDILIGASLRLAHAILLAMAPLHHLPNHAGPQKGNNNNNSDNDERAQQVCQQLIACLSIADQNVWDMVASGQGYANDQSNQLLSRHAVAHIRTVQAVLEQMPDNMLRRYMLPNLWEFPGQPITNRNQNDGLCTSHDRSSKSLRRLGAILALPRHDFARLCRIFLLPLSNAKTTPSSLSCPSTIKSELLRLASQFAKVELFDDLSQVREDACMVLRLYVQAMTLSNFSHGAQTVNGTDLICVALIHAVAAGDMDTSTNQHSIHALKEQIGTGVLGIKIPQQSSGDYDRMVHVMAQRAKWLIVNFLKPGLASSPSESSSFHALPAADLPPSRFFHWLLWLYFWSASSSPGKRSMKALRVSQQVQLAVMMLLPLLCEQVPPESLFLRTVQGTEEEQQEEAILPMIKLILASCAAQRDGIEPTNEDALAPDPDFSAAQSVLHELFYEKNSAAERSKARVETDAPPCLSGGQTETLLSICSIVLSLLVAMLELGLERRPRDQEELLISLMPLLGRLATVTEPSYLPPNALDENGEEVDNLASNAEIAEMASHALVLIASREAGSSKADDNIEPSEQITENYWEGILNQAQVDLASDEPPIRARGVVALRHLIRGDYTAKRAEKPECVRSAKIEVVELTSDNGISGSDGMIDRILQLCFMALEDSESFVYLAAIQTIVATADAYPRLVLPLLAQALCTGVFVHLRPIASPANEMSMTVEQRIKVAEALLFAIRRRASVYEYIPLLMAYMVQGISRSSTEKDLGSDETSASTPLIEIQTATHEYFVHGNVRDDDGVEPTVQERMEATRIRLATGGPLFDTEENDILRASCIQVAAELIMAVSHPSVLSKYCSSLVNLASNALSLDVSRPVRRAAARLSRELYAAVKRELNDILASGSQTGCVPSTAQLMAIELVSSSEDALLAALERSVSVDLGTHVQKFGFDPATVARCQEAIVLREECEEGGILAAARIVVASRKQTSRNHVARIVNKRLEEGTKKDVVKLMFGGEIDRDTLSLNL